MYPHLIPLLHFIGDACLKLNGLLQCLHEHGHLLLVLLPFENVVDVQPRDGGELHVESAVYGPILGEDGGELRIEFLERAG